VEDELCFFEETLGPDSTREGFQSGEVYWLIHKPGNDREPWVWINILHEYDIPGGVIKGEAKREAT
jgi:hypothetical protein